MKYLSSRIDDTVFESFNLACAEIGTPKQSVIRDLLLIFIEEKRKGRK